MTSLGIDIGGTSVKAAMLRDGRVISRGQSAAYAKPDTEQIIDAIRQASAGFDLAPGAAGICCPGLLDRAARTIRLAVNVPGLVGVRLDELLQRALGDSLPAATMISDAAATAFDLYATQKLVGRFLCLTLGTGVGAAVIDEGGFLHVSGETPGHFGQIDVSLDEHPPVGPDGGAGSLEAYIGAAALLERYGENAVDRLLAEDAPIRALVRAIRIGHALYRPEHVALAGGIGIRLARLLPRIKVAVDKQLTKVAKSHWTLLAGASDFHAACGAARYAAKAEARIEGAE